MAFVALFSMLATLGLNGIVVRDLVRKPELAHVTLGTTLVLQFAGGLVAFLLSLLVIVWMRPADSYMHLIIGIIGFALVFRGSEVIRYWFESLVLSKYSVWIGSLVFLVIALFKVIFILQGAQLADFAWLVPAEAILLSLGMLYVYIRHTGGIVRWSFQLNRAKTLILDSLPLMLSGLAVMIYMRIDQVMLGSMIGNEEVGVYSAAVQLSEAAYFIPMAVVASVFPAIIAAKSENDAVYQYRTAKLYDTLVLIACAIALPVSLFANHIIGFLYGNAFLGAGNILALHIWGAVFVFLGVASSNWFILENLQKMAFYRAALGAIINVAANYVLIPKYGGLGAAAGTVLSQFFAAYLFDMMSKKTRYQFWVKTGSLLPFLRIIRHGQK
tara:strand:+ start:130553 stop:131707 length:1155 start_codon:yes stop_codon:yes gene_type:complete